MEQDLSAQSQSRITGLQGGKEVGEEGCGVIGRGLEREPGGRKSTRGQPVGKQGGFAEPSRCRKEEQCPFQALLQSLDQVGTMHQVWARARNVEFGGKQRIGRLRSRRCSSFLLPQTRLPTHPRSFYASLQP